VPGVRTGPAQQPRAPPHHHPGSAQDHAGTR